MRKKRSWKMWAIYGWCGLYVGTWYTRKDAIKAHCGDKGKLWKDCRRDGDRAIRVLVTELKRGRK